MDGKRVREELNARTLQVTPLGVMRPEGLSYLASSGSSICDIWAATTVLGRTGVGVSADKFHNDGYRPPFHRVTVSSQLFLYLPQIGHKTRAAELEENLPEV